MMTYKINNDGIFEIVTHEEFCALKGIKPILKPIKHKINKKDRVKRFHQHKDGETIQQYVTTFLYNNNLKRD